jgi:hypothetical protein
LRKTVEKFFKGGEIIYNKINQIMSILDIIKKIATKNLFFILLSIFYTMQRPNEMLIDDR